MKVSRFVPSLGLLLTISLILVSCAAPAATPTLTATSAPTSLPTATPLGPAQPAPELRLAVLGEMSDANIWSLFAGADNRFWTEAVQGEYWPRLYRLWGPNADFLPWAAAGQPSALTAEGNLFTATVSLRPGLTWSDGSPFSAADVAFTGNTVLAFQLDKDWQTYYDPALLDHLEAVDNLTVRYYFKQVPSVADWQYGVLLAPVIQQAYWDSKLTDARELLPDPSFVDEIATLSEQVDALQAQVDEAQTSMENLNVSDSNYQTEQDIVNRTEQDLTPAKRRLEIKQAEASDKLTAARQALFALPHDGEPSLGPWTFGHWDKGNSVTNTLNPQYFAHSLVIDQYTNGALAIQKEDSSTFAVLGQPVGDPSLIYASGPFFEKVTYQFFDSQQAALEAFKTGQVDFILSPDGLPQSEAEALSSDPAVTVVANPRSNLRYLSFNVKRPALSDAALRQAMACVIDVPALSESTLARQITPANGFVPAFARFWSDSETSLPCDGQDGQTRLETAVETLKAAGYAWGTEPAWSVENDAPTPGTGLTNPGGAPLPHLVLLSPEASYDLQRFAVANYVVHALGILGIEVDLRQESFDDLLVDVYGVQNYDLALLGAQLGQFPSYLCDLYEPASLPKLQSACQAFMAQSELEPARWLAFDLQRQLVNDLPYVPLYFPLTYDAFRNLRYPYLQMQDGLGAGQFAAPDLAVPTEQ